MMIRKHVTTNEMVKKLLNVIETRVSKAKRTATQAETNLRPSL
jgi:hypothetical protein